MNTENSNRGSEKTTPQGDGPPGGRANALAGRLLQNAYRLEEQIGQGGMGVVYRARQITLDRAVAVKIIRTDQKGLAGSMERFVREARILSQLQHPNIVQIIDFGCISESLFFMVMEHLMGETLERFVLDRREVVAELVLELAEQIVAALTAAHQRQVIHRDLKPANVYIADVPGDGPPVVKVLDFGLGKDLSTESSHQGHLTWEGQILGTCGYSAPEQMNGERADERSDLYALGATLYYLIAGRPPYPYEGGVKTRARQLTRPPDPLTAPGLTPRQISAAEAVLRKAMNIDRDRRHNNPWELLVELQEALLGPREAARERKRSGLVRIVRPAPRPAPLTPADPRSPTVVESRPEFRPSPPSPGRRGLLTALLAACLAGILTLGGWLLWGVASSRHPALAVPGVRDTEIVFGLGAPLSGSDRDIGQAVRIGIESAFAQVNDAGGVLRRKLRLVALDQGPEPARAREVALRLLDEEGVFALLGNVGAGPAETSLPLALERKRIYFAATTGSRLLRLDPPDRYVFNFRPGYGTEMAALVRYLTTVVGLSPGSLAVFAPNDCFGNDGYDAVVRALRKAGHTTAIPRFGYEGDTTDVTAAVRDLVARQRRVRAVVLAAGHQPAARFVRKVRDAGLDMTFATVSFPGLDTLAEELGRLGPRYARGLVATQIVPHFRSNATGVIRYREALERYFPGEKFSHASLEAHVAARVLIEGLRRAGRELTTDKLVEALEGIKDLDLAIGIPIRFGPSEHDVSQKVWGSVLDEKGMFQSLSLE
jgi:serine/threonine protein kinase/ABC-type branched-subunit amino acid transport system substrate-binding protein